MCFFVAGYDDKHHTYDRIGQAKQMFTTTAIPANMYVTVITCNRIELYGHATKEQLIALRKEFPDMFLYTDNDAKAKLVLTCASIYTPIISDEQVFGQVRRCYANRTDLDTSVVKTFNHAFGLTKKIVAKTGINKNKISFGVLVYNYIKDNFSGMESVAVLGTGEIGKDMLNKCKKLNLTVVGRNTEKLKECERKYKLSNAITFDKFSVDDYDIIITCLNLQNVYFTNADYEKIKHFKTFIDMGNPRNVEPSNVDRITVVDVPFFKPLFTKLFEDKIVLIDKCLELLHVDLGTGPLFIESKLNYGNRTDI